MQKDKNNLWIITFGDCLRLSRLREEGKKKGIEVNVLKSYDIQITNDKVFYEGTEIEFKDGDIVWSISNNAVGHYVVQYLQQKFEGKIKFIWPNVEANKFADKFWTSIFFSMNNINTPKTVFVNTYKDEKIEKLVNYVGGYPCIIKACVGSMGENVEMVQSSEEAKSFIEKNIIRGVDVPFRRKSFLLQEFIEESKGTDYRVLCIDGEIIGAIKREAVSGFKSNVSLGGVAIKFEVDEKLKKYSKDIMKRGNLFYAGIDFMKKGDDYVAIEVNTSAQFKGFEAATGINVAEKIIDKLIEKRVN